MSAPDINAERVERLFKKVLKVIEGGGPLRPMEIWWALAAALAIVVRQAPPEARESMAQIAKDVVTRKIDAAVADEARADAGHNKH